MPHGKRNDRKPITQTGAGAVYPPGGGYVLFALALGLVVNHAVTVPAWLREAVRTEYYIKTGLVVLGAGILFDEIARAGLLGIAQAIVVVLSVWTFSFWLARRLRVDDEFATMLSSAVAICGVSIRDVGRWPSWAGRHSTCS